LLNRLKYTLSSCAIVRLPGWCFRYVLWPPRLADRTGIGYATANARVARPLQQINASGDAHGPATNHDRDEYAGACGGYSHPGDTCDGHGHTAAIRDRHDAHRRDHTDAATSNGNDHEHGSTDLRAAGSHEHTGAHVLAADSHCDRSTNRQVSESNVWLSVGAEEQARLDSRSPVT